MARTYVVTGDAKFERMYWEILAIRNGAAPRPRHYERIHWDLVVGASYFEFDHDIAQISLRSRMEQVGFTPAELGKLEEAENQSNELVESELVGTHCLQCDKRALSRLRWPVHGARCTRPRVGPSHPARREVS